MPHGGAVERMLVAIATVAGDQGGSAQPGGGPPTGRCGQAGATLVAVCPHPAWDGLLAGLHSLPVVWQVVAALYEPRPSAFVTVAGGPVAAEPKVRLREAGGGRDSWGHRSLQKTTV